MKQKIFVQSHTDRSAVFIGNGHASAQDLAPSRVQSQTGVCTMVKSDLPLRCVGRQAFTLIELVMVVVILAILMGLVFIGLGDSLEWARVNRSAYLITVAFDEARQATMARSLNHTVIFNSVKDPREQGEIDRVGSNIDDEEADYRVEFELEEWGDFRNVPYFPYMTWMMQDPDSLDSSATYPTIGSALMPKANGMNSRRHMSKVVSKKRKDNWLAIMGPYKDQLGIWRQVQGGMPIKNKNSVDANRRPTWTTNDYEWNGGVFGHPLNNGQLAADRYLSYAKISEAVWDPYGVMVGTRRQLERGTRWAARCDNPWWNVTSNDIPAYQLVSAAFMHTARSMPAEWRSASYMNNALFNFNTTPSGYVCMNQIDPTVAYPPKTFDIVKLAGDISYNYSLSKYMAISSNKTRPATYTDDAGTLTWEFERPVAMQYLTIWATGEIVVNNQPVFCK